MITGFVLQNNLWSKKMRILIICRYPMVRAEKVNTHFKYRDEDQLIEIIMRKMHRQILVTKRQSGKKYYGANFTIYRTF